MKQMFEIEQDYYEHGISPGFVSGAIVDLIGHKLPVTVTEITEPEKVYCEKCQEYHKFYIDLTPESCDGCKHNYTRDNFKPIEVRDGK